MNKVNSIDDLKDLINFVPSDNVPLAPSLCVSHERMLGNHMNVGFSFEDMELGKCMLSIEHIDHSDHIEAKSSFILDGKCRFERKCKIDNHGNVIYSYFWVSHVEFKNLDPEGYIRLVKHRLEDEEICLVEVWGYPQNDFPHLVFIDINGIALLPLRNSEDIYTIINK